MTLLWSEEEKKAAGYLVDVHLFSKVSFFFFRILGMFKILSNGYPNHEILDPDPLSKLVLVNRCTEVRNKYTLPWVHSICYSCESTCYSIRVVCWNSFCLITLMIHVLFWTPANYLPMPHSFLESSFQTTESNLKTKFWKWHRWSFRTADCFFFIIIELIGEDGRLLFFLEQIGEDSRLLITLLTELSSLQSVRGNKDCCLIGIW